MNKNTNTHLNLLTKTLYGDITKEVFDRAKKIKLLVCDVDGVFSDGRIYLGNDGEELKAFHTKDGFGIKALGNSGVEVAIITGRRSAIVANRMTALNVKHIVQGQENKLPALQHLAEQLKLSPDEIAYIGDDINDMVNLNSVAWGFCPNNSVASLIPYCDVVLNNNGGDMAIREGADFIIKYNQRFE